MPDLCFTDAQEAACAKAKGWPAEPKIYNGTDAPENNVVGYWIGDLYVRTNTNKLYFFDGVPGTMVGWNILN